VTDTDKRIANIDEQGETAEGYRKGHIELSVRKCQYDGKKEEVTEFHSPAQSD